MKPLGVGDLRFDDGSQLGPLALSKLTSLPQNDDPLLSCGDGGRGARI
jgi:hypothetical protein